MAENSPWAIVLAGGEGKRLARISFDALGRPCPKQFWSFDGDRPLIQTTLDRARSIASPDTVMTVVTSRQRFWWESELDTLPRSRIVDQSHNRGTAFAILVPLLMIIREDPDAKVVILPSDHHVALEAVLRGAILHAIDAVEHLDGGPVLLGFTPEHPATDLGWLLPTRSPAVSICRVSGFFEKPSRELAEELFSRGALWNGFILVATAARLVRLFDESFPSLSRDIDAAIRSGVIDELYERLPELDFSRHILGQGTGALWVSPVPWCGWSDIGTPERVSMARRLNRPFVPSSVQSASR